MATSVAPAARAAAPRAAIARVLRGAFHGVAAAGVVSIAGCFSVPPTYENDFLVEKIDRQYALRDACLRQAAAQLDDGQLSADDIGKATARTCSSQTDRLIALTDPARGPRTAAAIAGDSVRRATGYVYQTRRAKAVRSDSPASPETSR